jgi:hypothetical protein
MKRKLRKLSLVSSLFLLTIVASGCIHKSGGAVTPWERVHTYNAALADANNAVEQGAEIAVSSNLMQPVQAAPIINMTGQVALLHQQITAILATGTATSANVSSVKAVVDQIKASLQALPASALGIKNPKSQQTFQQDVSGIGTLADALLAALEAVTGSSSSLSPIYSPVAPTPYAAGGGK